MPDLPEAILDQIETRIGRRIAAHRGVIKAVDTTAGVATVTIAAGDVTSMRWLSPYVPIVNDSVLMLRVGDEWMVLGKVSQSTTPAAGTVTQTTTFNPITRYVGLRNQVFALQAGGLEKASSTPISTSYGWSTTVLPQQGWWREYIFGSELQLHEHTAATFWWHALNLPAGATINAAKVAFARRLSGPDLVTPRIYGHTIPSGGAVSGSATAYLHGSFGPWSPGTLLPGQYGQWDLPSSWLAALLAGTIKGLAVYSGSAADYTVWTDTSPSLELTYTYTP